MTEVDRKALGLVPEWADPTLRLPWMVLALTMISQSMTMGQNRSFLSGYADSHLVITPQVAHLHHNEVFLLIPGIICSQAIVVERMGYDRHSDP
ncbi:MAG: hypothetical protein MUQ30_06515 [Anaerolineae bacterium]|nr:hypothetical protein [Anaerolineae bacterium]